MSVTKVTKYCEKQDGRVGDINVTVIDTPGLFETDRNREEIVREILQRVKLLAPGPHAFVLVLPIGGMTQEDKETYTLIETMFGPRVWDYTIVLFTHGDRLDGKTIRDIITESDENLRNFIRKCKTLKALNGGSCYENKMYPEKEKKIRERQESILAESAEEIEKEERRLQE